MELTELINRAQDGDHEAADQAIAVLADELRGIAGRIGNRPGRTLTPTALVNEAYLRIADQSITWKSRGHFLGYAARAMRSVLVDYARRRNSKKRGGEHSISPLDEALTWFEEQNLDVLALHDALDILGEHSERQRRLVELRFFVGIDNKGAAEALGISKATADRDWAVARARLGRILDES